jgi:hypothetical protein
MTQNLSSEHDSDTSTATGMTDHTVGCALAAIWRSSGWRRLEIGYGTDGTIGGYCITSAGLEVDTAQALREGRYSPVMLNLSAVLKASGWRRLEFVSRPGASSAGGWCERGDGSGLYVTTGPGS